MVAALDPRLTAAEIVALKKEGVADLRDVIVFGVGQHHDGDIEFTQSDLDTLVANFNALSAGDNPLLNVPIGIGHEHTAAPAVGRVTKLWATPDGLLHATFSDLPRRFAEALDFEVWRYPSIVFDDEPPKGCPGSGFTLRSIDVVDQPAVKRLLKMPKPQWRRGDFCERGRSQRLTRDKSRTFSEVVMDRKALEEQLKSLGWSDATIAALANLPDEDFAIFVNTVLADAAGASAPAETPAAEGDMPPTREQMIADLVAAGEDPAMLEGMSDADLLALWTQKIGGSASEHSEGKPVATTVTPPVAPAAELTPAQFSELKAGLTQAQQDLQKVRRESALLQANQRREFAESARRSQAERLASIKSYCERWSRDGYVLPREVDPKSKTPNLYHRLVNADGVKVRQFGETKVTEFDAIVQEIEERGKDFVKRFFSEKITADPAQTSKYDDARKAALARHAQRSAGRNDTPAQRLGLLAPASHR